MNKKLQIPTVYITPQGPYKFQSGKNKNRFAEELIFTDPASIVAMYERMNAHPIKGEKNQLHKHLDWLLYKAQKIQPSATCPHCGQKKVKFFGINWGCYGNITENDTACEDCVQILKGPETIIREINFVEIAALYDPRMKSETYKKGVQILLWAHNIKQTTSVKQLFEIFKQA